MTQSLLCGIVLFYRVRIESTLYVHSVEYTLYSTYCRSVQCTVYSVYTVHCTVHCIVYTPNGSHTIITDQYSNYNDLYIYPITVYFRNN